MDFIEYIIIAVVSFVIGLLFRTGVPAYIKKKFENLADKQDIGILTTKMESIKFSFEKDKIRFSLYHQNQVEMLRTLYANLTECLDMMREFVCPIYTDTERYERELKNISDHIKLVDDFTKRNVIYLSNDLKLKVNELMVSFRQALLYKNLSQQNIPMTEAHSKQYMTAFDQLEEKSTPILNQIEQSFREILSGENSTVQ